MGGISNLSAIPAILFLTLSLPGCVWEGEAGEDPSPAEGPSPTDASTKDSTEPEKLETAVADSIEPGLLRRRFTIDTHLVVDKDITIKARMSGIVADILVERGDWVHRGALLLTLENRDLELFLRRAEILRDQKQVEFRRAKTLHEKEMISPSEFGEKELEFRSAEVDVDIAREELARSLVRAPFDGLIMDRFAKLGEKIIEEEYIPLFRLTKLAPLEARLYLPEDVVRSLREGDEVTVVPRYLPDATTPGRVEWISQVIDTSSGTSLAIVSVPGGGRNSPLRPGTAVTVKWDLPAGGTGVMVPRSALGEPSNIPWTRSARVEVLKDGIRSWRRVQLGEIHGDRVEVLEGLHPGETVVLKSGGNHR